MLDFACLTHYDWLDLPMWVFDPGKQRNLWANAAALRFWQAESAEEFLAYDHADMSEPVRERLAVTAADHAQGKIVREQWTLYPRGEPRTVSLVSRAIRTPQGRPVMLFAAESPATGADLAMLRGVEAMQHTSERVAVFSLQDGSVLMRNPAAALAFNLAEHAGGPGSFERLFVLPEDAARVLKQVQTGQSCTPELELHTHAGPRWHSLCARPMRDPATGDLALQLNAHDISALKASQVALLAAREAAEAANQAKSRFLAHMSHEIRTPMNGVLGLTELVLQTQLDERQRRFLELAHGSAKSLMAIINDLLDVAKIEAGRVVIELRPFSLHACLREALRPLALQARDKSVQLGARIQPGVPDQLVGDAQRLRQVLINLVSNALKFTERGEVRVEVEASPAQALDTPHLVRLRIAVSDTGIGMTPAQVAQIFAPFNQADDSITRRYGGTGLGLTIVQRLVELMGGRVQVESELGVGSCFSFEIALQGAAPAAEGAAAAAPAESALPALPVSSDR